MALPLIMAGVGLGLQVFGQLKAGNAAKKAAESAAKREEYNAQVAELQADDALARGREQQGLQQAQVRRMVGTQRAGFAAQGIDVGSGSAADVQADTTYLGELDRLTIGNNAAREAWGYRVEAEDRRMAADVARKGGQAAQTASRWDAANTVVGGASMMMDRYGWGSKSSSRGGGRGGSLLSSRQGLVSYTAPSVTASGRA